MPMSPTGGMGTFSIASSAVHSATLSAPPSGIGEARHVGEVRTGKPDGILPPADAPPHGAPGCPSGFLPGPGRREGLLPIFFLKKLPLREKKRERDPTAQLQTGEQT